jgi:hypothetical protein
LVELGGSSSVIGVVMGQKDARDAGQLEAGGFDIAQEPVGVTDHAPDAGVDQSKLISAVEQIDIAVEGSGQIEPEHPAADKRYLRR